MTTHQKLASKALSDYKKICLNIDSSYLESFLSGFNASRVSQIIQADGKQIDALFIETIGNQLDLYLYNRTLVLYSTLTNSIVRVLDLSNFLTITVDDLRSIDNLDISIRAYQMLKANDIRTVKDLLSLSSERIKSLRDISRKSIEEIEEVIKQYRK